MFLTPDQIILIRDHAKRRSSDATVYVMNHPIRNGKVVYERTFWPAFTQEECTDREHHDLVRYGTIYQDANQSWCIVPDQWNEDDANLAKYQL